MSRLLKKEEEVDVEVFRVDQDRINTFGRLNSRFHELEDELKEKKTQIQNLQDASNEIYLSDEVRFELGEVFVRVETDECDELLQKELARVEAECSSIERQMDEIKTRMSQLKGLLYAKFGKTINLEED
eukprot:TRINITY_DN598_c0_g1_i1.p1 TRINITY_DN598_c0_g1~~TRINITY_DN598_c0_g1_i1.p1  ORF type:complete len:149 (-),score=51.87 TRINITY_DN598_c0_g1_i1:48-434(-)